MNDSQAVVHLPVGLWPSLVLGLFFAQGCTALLTVFQYRWIRFAKPTRLPFILFLPLLKAFCVLSKLRRRQVEETDLMVSLERQTWIEFVSRHGILFCLVLLGYIGFDYLVPLIWFGIYMSTSVLSYFLLERMINDRRFRVYLSVLAVFALRIVLLRIFLLYLWFQPEAILQMPAICLLLASVRFSINQKTRIKTYSLIQAAGDVAVLVIIAIHFLFILPDTPTNLIGGLSTAGFVIYYLVTLQQAYVGLAAYEKIQQRSVQAQKMEAVGNLTGGVAHDFNNILTVVMGNLELYREVDDPLERDELVHKAREAAERASVLTSQLLAFSRQTALQEEAVATKLFLEEMHALTERILPADIQFECSCPDNTWPMWVDRVQLGIAILNLVINARDAMPNGGTMRLTAHNIPQGSDVDPSKDSDYVKLCLADEGDGIASDIHDRVFEPFFTTKDIGKGSGLGLSMVKGFVEQSGGTVDIRSAPDRGTKICLSIPAVLSQSSQD